MKQFGNLRWVLPVVVMVTMSLLAPVRASPSKAEESPSTLGRSAFQYTYNWILTEIEKYQSFPKLDLAVRLLKAGRIGEAKRELDSVLARNPNDLSAASTYVILLYQTRDYSGVIARTTSILTRGIPFTSGLIYRGLAYQALTERTKALADFRAVRTRADLDTPTRIFCLETIVDLALAEKDYHLVLSASDSLQLLRQSAHVAYARALALQALGRTSEAAMALVSALNETGRPRERLMLLQALATMEGQLRDWKRASETYRNALSIDANDPDLLRGAAETAYQAGDLPEAIRLMRRRLDLRPDATARQYLANLLLAHKDYSAAEEEFRLSLGESHDLAQRSSIYRALVELARLRKDTPEAIGLLKSMLAEGGSAQDKRSLISLLEEEKDYATLIDQLQIWLAHGDDRDPDRYQEYLTLGNLYYARKDLGSALTAFSQAVKLSHAAAGFDSLAQTLEELGKIQDAIAARRRLGELHPDALNYVKLAALYEKSAQPNEELGALNAALRAGPSPELAPDIYCRLGYLHAGQHHQQEALAAFGRALKSGGDRADVHGAIAEIYTDMGDYRQALPHLERARDLEISDKILKMLALAYSETGRLAQSAAVYEELLNRVRHPSPEAAELETSLAHIEVQRMRFGSAGASFQRAFEDGSKTRAILLYWAAQSYFQAQNWTKAAEAYSVFLTATPKPAIDSAAAAWENLALCQEKLGRNQDAARSLDNALVAGGNRRELHERLGYLYYRLNDWNESLNHFLSALNEESGIRPLLGAARCYQHLNKPGMAIYYLSQAAARGEELPPSEIQAVLADLGNLYMSVAEYDSAAEVWEKTLRLQEDPTTRLQLVRSRRLSGQSAAAEEALQYVNPEQLPAKLRSQYFDERFALLKEKGEIEESAGLLRQANEFAPEAWRYYQLGLFEGSEGRVQESIADLRAALARDPDSGTYAQALAYAFERAGERQNALRMFTVLAQRDPGNPRWKEALAYEDLRLSRNAEAADNFRRALDDSASPGDDENSLQHTYGLRSELAELNRRYDFTFYHFYVSNSYAGVPGFGLVGSSIFPASSGMEFAYRPPHVGVRNGKILEVFTRLLWSTPSNTSLFQMKQYQGSAGIRYKPFTRTNVWISMERLFHTTNFSGGGWMLRGTHSWNIGADLKPGRTTWKYVSALSDSAYVFGGLRFLMQYEEMREGLTIRIANNLLLTPHLVEAGRWQSQTGVLGSYLEGGGGASIRYLFNENRYDAPRSSFEILVQFKRGIVFRQGGIIGNDVEYDGCSLAGIFRL